MTNKSSNKFNNFVNDLLQHTQKLNDDVVTPFLQSVLRSEEVSNMKTMCSSIKYTLSNTENLKDELLKKQEELAQYFQEKLSYLQEHREDKLNLMLYEYGEDFVERTTKIIDDLKEQLKKYTTSTEENVFQRFEKLLKESFSNIEKESPIIEIEKSSPLAPFASLLRANWNLNVKIVDDFVEENENIDKEKFTLVPNIELRNQICEFLTILNIPTSQFVHLLQDYHQFKLNSVTPLYTATLYDFVQFRNSQNKPYDILLSNFVYQGSPNGMIPLMSFMNELSYLMQHYELLAKNYKKLYENFTNDISSKQTLGRLYKNLDNSIVAHKKQILSTLDKIYVLRYLNTVQYYIEKCSSDYTLLEILQEYELTPELQSIRNLFSRNDKLIDIYNALQDRVAEIKSKEETGTCGNGNCKCKKIKEPIDVDALYKKIDERITKEGLPKTENTFIEQAVKENDKILKQDSTTSPLVQFLQPQLNEAIEKVTGLPITQQYDLYKTCGEMDGYLLQWTYTRAVLGYAPTVSLRVILKDYPGVCISGHLADKVSFCAILICPNNEYSPQVYSLNKQNNFNIKFSFSDFEHYVSDIKFGYLT